MADKKEKLFSDFSPASTEQWMEKVTADLKGADFEKKLVWKTNEGFKVKPFYRMEDLEDLKTTDALPGEFPYLRGTKKDNNAWLVRQEIRVECPKEANAKALDILNKGVDSLSFHVKAKELNAEYIETLLSDIQAECVELNFSTCQGHVVELANLLVAYFQKKDYDVKKLKGSINYDFFNKMLTRGKEKGDMVQTAKSLIEAIQPLPFYRVLNVNALSLNNAGAYISQELGYALAWASGNVSKEPAPSQKPPPLWPCKEQFPANNCQYTPLSAGFPYRQEAGRLFPEKRRKRSTTQSPGFSHLSL